MLDVLHVLATTRSIHRYLPDAVPEADLSRMLYAATRAPSASNAQPARFVVLRADDDGASEARRLLGRSFRAAWAKKTGRDRWWEGSGTDSSSPKARVGRSMQEYVAAIESVPVIILACLVRFIPSYPHEGASVYPACQNLLIAARCLGYGATFSTWHQECEPELRPLLGIPDDVFIAATITLGRPAGQHGPVRRRPLGDVVFDGRWDAPAPWASDPAGSRLSKVGPPPYATMPGIVGSNETSERTSPT